MCVCLSGTFLSHENNVIIIDQVITHHTKLNPKNVQTCLFDGNLLPESAPVRSTASGERGNNVIVIDQVITHRTKLNTKNIQTCEFKGNLLAESAPVHSTAFNPGPGSCL